MPVVPSPGVLVRATLPRCALSGDPTWVDDDVGAVAAAVASAKRVAFDCEFSAVPDRVATLQVALDDGRVFVVDGTLNLDPLVDALAARRALCFGASEDLRRLPSRDWSRVDDLQRRFPRHKAPSLQRVVAEVLGDAQLRAKWTAECKAMADRISEMRAALKAKLADAGSTRDWAHITDQIGMFAYTGLTADQVQAMRDEFHVYCTLDGRISVAGLN